jgi:uncharacterized protein YciI
LPYSDRIDFLVYSRTAASAENMGPDRALTEEHWSYMDRFADGMIARGPTFAADRATWTGSLHIVQLRTADAAHEFVAHEPYNRAGLFEDHLILRFRNLLGRTMWEFPRESVDPRFLVIAHPRAKVGEDALKADFTALPSERLIVHGELLTLHEATSSGAVLALQAPTREAVDSLLRGALAGLDERYEVEILDWEFGGRR